jgi:hypothetical protein
LTLVVLTKIPFFQGDARVNLYFIYTRNWTAMNDALADVTAEDKKDLAVKHALDVR